MVRRLSVHEHRAVALHALRSAAYYAALAQRYCGAARQEMLAEMQHKLDGAESYQRAASRQR